MNTNIPISNLADPLTGVTVLSPDSGWTDAFGAASLPDVEEIARLASELFAAPPGGSDAAALAAAAQPSSVYEVPHFNTPPVAYHVPTDADLRELSAPAPVSAASQPALAATAAQPPTQPVYEVPHFNTPPVAYHVPTDADLRELLAPAPVSAASHPAQAASVGQTFYFLDDITPLGRSIDAHSLGAAHPPFDVHAIRRDFPILSERVNGKPLVWLDNAATTQKPQTVIDRLSYFYQHENSNIHRAAHELAARATDAYEEARTTSARFLNASSADEIVFVRGSTEAINLVAQSWGRQNLGAGDEIVITWLEHHANIVPWQQLCAVTGAVLRVVPVDNDGQVLLDEYQKLLGNRTRLVSLTQVSNALGTVTPAREMVELAHRIGARVLIDGAQAVSHMAVNVQQLDCDWYVFSGHKVFGPTGIGVLYGKQELLNAMQPWQGGGNMIEDVTFERTRYQAAPARFEAGTGNIADAVGLGAALEYVQNIGMANIARYEHELLRYATVKLNSVPGLRHIGTAPDKAGVLSFVLEGFRSEDIGAALNRNGIAVRSGHHCAQPILRRFGLENTVRPSLALYNTCADIDALVVALLRIQGGKELLRG